MTQNSMERLKWQQRKKCENTLLVHESELYFGVRRDAVKGVFLFNLMVVDYCAAFGCLNLQPCIRFCACDVAVH